MQGCAAAWISVLFPHWSPSLLPDPVLAHSWPQPATSDYLISDVGLHTCLFGPHECPISSFLLTVKAPLDSKDPTSTVLIPAPNMLSVSSIFILAVDPELQKYLLLKYQELSEIWQSVLAKKLYFAFSPVLKNLIWYCVTQRFWYSKWNSEGHSSIDPLERSKQWPLYCSKMPNLFKLEAILLLSDLQYLSPCLQTNIHLSHADTDKSSNYCCALGVFPSLKWCLLIWQAWITCNWSLLHYFAYSCGLNSLIPLTDRLKFVSCACLWSRVGKEALCSFCIRCVRKIHFKK